MSRVASTTWSLHKPAIRALVTLGASLFVARALGRFSAVPDAFLWLIIPLSIAVVLFLRDPRWCVAGIVVGTFFGLHLYGVSLGPVTVRFNDLPYCFLFGWVVLLRSRQGRAPHAFVGQRRIALFLAVLGVSVLPGFVLGLADTPERLVSWMRLVATLSLVWLVPYALPKEKDRLLILNVLWMTAAVELLYSLVTQFGDARLSGRNGPNSEGLLAALLIALAVHSPLPERRWLRVAIGAIGVVAILKTKSIASMASVGIALGVFGLRPKQRRHGKEPLITPIRVIALLLGLVGVVSILRPHDLPSSRRFKQSSSSQRLLLGFAGMKIFVDHPIAGVGWQRSSAEEIIASEEINEELRGRFSDFRQALFPTEATSVHNMYVQVLADTGIIGGLILVLAIIAIVRGTRRVLAGTPPGRTVFRAAAVCLFIVAIWWNDNPLFGALPESVSAAVFLGLLASARTRPGQSASAPEPPAPAEEDISNPQRVPHALPTAQQRSPRPPAQ